MGKQLKDREHFELVQTNIKAVQEGLRERRMELDHRMKQRQEQVCDNDERRNI